MIQGIRTRTWLAVAGLGLALLVSPARASQAPSGTTALPADVAGGAGTELTLWVEYPSFGAPLSGLDGYFAALIAFVEGRQIDRIIIRVQDPGTFTLYQPPPETPPACTTPSATYPNILDETTQGQDQRNACCITTCGGSGLWCSGYEADGNPTQGTHQCAGGCGATVPCGSGDPTGLFFTRFLLDPAFVATGCEVYVVPWLDDADPWTYPAAGSNNVEKAAAWIQLANVYSSAHGGRLISGFVYEQESAGIWSNKVVALPAIEQALTSALAPPSPAYTNAAQSPFKLASASQFDFDDGGTGVYLNQIFPQVYNLTSGTGSTVRVDATSDAKLLADPSSYSPDFPETIYTHCTTPSSITGLCGFASLIRPSPPPDRAADVHYMFSTELAPKTVEGIANPYHLRGATITGACDPSDAEEACVGTINAFGSPGWSWDRFASFLRTWGATNGAQNFGIFQFNMLPPDWAPPPPEKPNILFIILDDVGIDQMRDFGYGGVTPPATPNITQVADEGIRFRNTWAMPACTTTRAVIFDGRFPLRTNVLGALGPNDLANSMVNPWETTTPRLLAQRGYDNALFGKFHLALQGNDPAGYAMPHQLGWDYFAGWLDETGDPSSIDTTAGGVAPAGTWSCGFVGGVAEGGANQGACYMADGSCEEMVGRGPVPPGRTCRDRGGILDPDRSCESPPPGYLDFQILSGHYVSPLVYNFPDGTVVRVPPTDPRSRQFRASMVVDEAIGWINDRPADRPWMASVSFASDHTPLMQPPVDSGLAGIEASSRLDCSDVVAQRELSNLMIESIDVEVGRLLVGTGLAKRGPDGTLLYDPTRSDTMVVLVGDNGSLATTIKLPFDLFRAKGTAYQSGVWVPLVVAGPLVRNPGRDVPHMVNVADLYSLFGEVAGIRDVRALVPRPLDAEPMLPYLRNPTEPSIRRWNYTEVGPNLQANGALNGPCTILAQCTQIPVSKSVCEDNNGVWWGEGADDPITEGIPPGGFKLCCEVDAFRVAQGETPYPITPLTAVGIRNDRYKIVENSLTDYVSQEQPCVETTTVEFYEINERVPIPRLDSPGTALPLDRLTADQQRNFDELSAELRAIRDSVVPCPGDGNIDLMVDQKDLEDWRFYAETTGLSSVYDMNLDGLTDSDDESVIRQNLGLDCRIR